MARQSKDKLGATPGKLALIALLVVVLVVVVMNNVPADETLPERETAAAAPLPAQPTTPVAAALAMPDARGDAENPFGDFATDGHWPKRPIDDVIRFDPLAKTEWARPLDVGPGGTLNDTNISELLAAKSAIIFLAGEKRVARIGDHDYFIGDAIGRYQITDITSQGVVLSEAK